MVDTSILLGRGNHLLSVLGIVDALDRSRKCSGFQVQRDHDQGGIPVVYAQQMLLRSINGEVTSGRTAGINLPDLFESSVSLDLVGKNLSILVAVLGARVYDVEARVDATKGGIDNFDNSLDVARNVEEAQGSIGRMKAIDCFHEKVYSAISVS